MIAIIDYGMGNLRSVHKAFEAVGAQVQVTHTVADIIKADKVVLPGVGAMGPAMQKLQELGLDGPIRRVIKEGKPFLGICLGLQLLFEKSSEGGFSEGLRILEGNVERFSALKVPHMGWNQVRFSVGEPLARELPAPWFYIVHSYYCLPADPKAVIATSDHGIPFCAGVRRGNLAAVQFHPEKSGPAGLKLLANFLAA